MLEGDDPGGGALALILRPHPGAFRQLMCPHLEEFAHFFFFFEMLMPGIKPGGGGEPTTLAFAIVLKEKRQEGQKITIKCSCFPF